MGTRVDQLLLPCAHCRKEEKRRYDEALGQAREANDGRAKELEEGWKREKEGLRKAHDKQVRARRCM